MGETGCYCTHIYCDHPECRDNPLRYLNEPAEYIGSNQGDVRWFCRSSMKTPTKKRNGWEPAKLTYTKTAPMRCPKPSAAPSSRLRSKQAMSKTDAALLFAVGVALWLAGGLAGEETMSILDFVEFALAGEEEQEGVMETLREWERKARALDWIIRNHEGGMAVADCDNCGQLRPVVESRLGNMETWQCDECRGYRY